MNLLNNLKVRTKLILSFIIIAIMIGIAGGVGMNGLNKTNVNGQQMYTSNLTSVYLLNEANKNISKVRADFQSLLYEKDINKDEVIDDINKATEEDNKNLEQYAKMSMADEEKKAWLQLKNQMVQYRDVRDKLIDLIKQNKDKEALMGYSELSNARENVQKNLDQLIKVNMDAAGTAYKNNISVYDRSRNMMLLLIALGFIFAVVLGLLLNRVISIPLSLAVSHLNVVAKKDFTNAVPQTFLKRKDEIGQLAKAVDVMQSDLSEFIKMIMSSSQDLSASTEELSASIEEMSARFESIDNSAKQIAGGSQETSASAEEITASVEEVNSSINEISGKALEGSGNASQIKERALSIKNNGNEAVEETAMLFSEREKMILDAIEDGKVVKEIKVMADTISSIAEQTNLLALNAAIEAARAGDQGKGFSVVADEVRKLAEQSSQAVSSIQDTIDRVRGAFDNLSDNSMEVLKFITDHIKPKFHKFVEVGNEFYGDADFVSKMSEDLASMSEELSVTTNQVSKAVQGMSSVAQQSSDNTVEIINSIDDVNHGIEQIAQTSQNQAELAKKLNDMVQSFKI